MNKHDNSNYILNELGSVLIGVVYTFILIYFLGAEFFGVWQKTSSGFLEVLLLLFFLRSAFHL